MSADERQPETAAERVERAEMAYRDLIAPLTELRASIVDLLRGPDQSSHILSDLVLSMWETHESMRAILKAAEEYEGETGRLTGGHADAILLARPQLESVFIALLILHDERDYVPKYHRAGWAATLRSQYATYEAMKDRQEIVDWWERQKDLFVTLGAKWGLTEANLAVIIAQARDEPIAEDRRAYRIRPLPIPGEIVDRNLLAGSAFAALIAPLYRQWKIACDPVHLGIPILAAKTFLRGGAIDNVPEIDRAVYLTSDIHHNSIIQSVVALLTCTTAIAISRFETESELLDKCGEAWAPIQARVPSAISIWNDWAASALRDASSS